MKENKCWKRNIKN